MRRLLDILSIKILQTTLNPKTLKLAKGYLLLQARDRSMNQEEWEKFLLAINIKSGSDIKLVTEAALFASLIETGIPRDLGAQGDTAEAVQCLRLIFMLDSQREALSKTYSF